jgi:hypothetical protein
VLLLYAPVPSVLIWTASLAAELLLVAALSLLCLFTFSQVTLALPVVAGFYLLARTMGAIQLMAAGPLTDPSGLTDRVLRWVVEAIAFLLPDLYRFASSEWLAYPGTAAAVLLPVLAQTAVYLLLLVGASLFDLYRREL